MTSYSYKRRSGFRSPFPVRFLALGLAILTFAFVAWPSAKEESSTSEVPVLTQDEDAAEDVTAAADKTTTSMKGLLQQQPKTAFAPETASETPPETQAQNLSSDAELTDNQTYAANMQGSLMTALNDAQSAAGLPIARGGVYLPEPRPEILDMANLTAEDLTARLAELQNKGVRPVSVKIQSGDTLAEALVKKLGVGSRDAHYAIESMKASFDPRDVRPGQTVTAYAADLKGEAQLMALTLQKDMLSSVTATRVTSDRFVTSEVERPTKVHKRAVRGAIENSLYLATNAENVPDRVTLELIRIYSWAIDFQRDIRANDQFEIMYEEHRTEDGKVVPGRGNILYATLTLGNRPYSMYRYETADKRVDYFEPDGQSVRKALMRTPVDGARISSNFGLRRHPVLGYSKMHKGTDFAAPSGTPIYAAGDGVIERANRFGSFGNYVLIRHRSNLKTAYAHLKGFARGMHAGKRVRQGDVIGYIGTTGRSTGPHLHYEVHLNGKQVNPASVKLPTGEKLTGSQLAAFKKQVLELNSQFAALGLGQTVVAQKMDSSSAVNTN